MTYFVYILQSLVKENYFYKGLTSDLDRRLIEHNLGKTPGNLIFKPYKIVFAQVCNSRIEARNLEKYLKSGSGREIINEII